MNTKSIFRVLTISLLISLTFAAFARKASPVASEDRELPAFNGLKLLCSADVYIRQGDAQQVRVSADRDVIEYLETRVEDGVLVVDMKKNRLFNVKVLEVHITVPMLDKILSMGSGDIRIDETFKTNRLFVKINGSGDLDALIDAQGVEMEINGSGDVEISGVKDEYNLIVRGSGDVDATDLRVESCTVNVSGSGDVELSGNCVAFTLKQTGSGDFNGYGLKAVNADVSGFGSGDIVLTVAESLRAQLNGSGDLTYRGNPTKVQVDAKGSGEVFRK